MNKILTLLIALTIMLSAEEDYESWTNGECYAEAGLSCEELQEEQEEAENNSDEGESDD